MGKLSVFFYIDEIEGRQDFVNETFTHIFDNSKISMKEVYFFVRFNDDEVAEYQEGFFVEIKVDESQLHLKDRDDIEYMRHGVALIRIEDNDGENKVFERNLL